MTTTGCSICENIFDIYDLEECDICSKNFCKVCNILKDGKCDGCIEDEKRAHEGDYYGIAKLKED